jgi:charged multivesicular body protein 1
VASCSRTLLLPVPSPAPQFEKQFENLDLQTQVVDDVMGQQANLTTPEDEVNALMAQVAEEHGLETALGMPSAAAAKVPAAKQSEDDLAARLADLRGR